MPDIAIASIPHAGTNGAAATTAVAEQGDERWHAFLQDGKPARQALHASGSMRVASGVDLHYQIFRVTYGAHARAAQQQQQPEQPAATTAPAAAEAGANGAAAVATAASGAPPPVIRMLMIMGFAAPGDAWLPTVHQLLLLASGQPSPPACTLEVCVFDNRGIGKSTVPAAKRAYTTEVMAADAHSLMDLLGWTQAHVVGFSMGGMIATKLASSQPQCVLSLTLISVTGGHWQVIPTSGKALRTALGGMWDKSDLGRAEMDVKFHFSHLTRKARLRSGETLGDVLVAQYVAASETSGRQAQAGEEGHLNAVWTHSVTPTDVRNIIAGKFPVKVIHGRYDMMADPKWGIKMATLLKAELVLVEGGHFTPRENATEIAYELLVTAFAQAHLPWAAPRPRGRVLPSPTERSPGKGGSDGIGDGDDLLPGRGGGSPLRRRGASCFACCCCAE